MKTPSLQDFKRWSRDHAEMAYTVAMAQAYAQCKREQVDAYIAPVFALFDFYPSEDMIEHGAKRERIADITHLYMTDLNGADYKRFMEECDKEHRAHGFKGPKGHCPALEAEHLQIIAENELLKALGSLMGVDLLGTYGDTRKKALDLAMGACLKARKAAA